MFTFQPVRTVRTVSTSAKSAKSVFTCLNFHIWNKKRQQPYSVEMVHRAWPKRQVVTSMQKNHPHCCKVSPAIIKNHTRTWTKIDQSHSVYGIFVSSFCWLIHYIKVSVRVWIYTKYSYSSAVGFSQISRKDSSSIWTLDQILSPLWKMWSRKKQWAPKKTFLQACIFLSSQKQKILNDQSASSKPRQSQPPRIT